MFNNHGNRDNKLRARMKWLVDTMGWDELQSRILKERHFLLASSSWPGGIPAVVDKHGDSPAGVAHGATPTPMGQGTPVAIRSSDAQQRWDDANVVRGVAKGTVSAYAFARLGDITSDQCARAGQHPARARCRRSA